MRNLQSTRRCLSLTAPIVFSMMLFLFPGGLWSQQKACALGMGGTDEETIIQVFQLTDSQQAQMEEWSAALQHYQKDLDARVQQLFESHPQQSMEELQELATKYQVLKEEAEATSMAFDRRLLSIFDERQYKQYVALCREAGREPMSPMSPIIPESGGEE